MKKLIIFLLISNTLFGQARYEIPCDERVFSRSLEILKALNGIKEKTNKNDGAKILEIQQVCGIYKGAPYCQATQYYSFYTAVNQLKLDKKLIPIPKSGLAQSSFNYAQKSGKKTAYKAEVGDLLVWKKGKTASGHIERVVEVGKMGWVLTVGGNVSTKINGKTQEGIFYKKRNIANPLSRLLTPKGLVGLK